MPHLQFLSDLARFGARMVARPVQVGAIAPSGPVLARIMASALPDRIDGPVLELGPGTGAFTRALIARGIPPEQITAIEYDPQFAALIRERFPGVRVIEGSAFDRDLLAGIGPFAGAISGLPLRNFPVDDVTMLARAVLDRLAPGAPFVQFSYGIRSPIPPLDGIVTERTAVVMANFPPARVWTYRAG